MKSLYGTSVAFFYFKTDYPLKDEENLLKKQTLLWQLFFDKKRGKTKRWLVRRIICIIWNMPSNWRKRQPPKGKCLWELWLYKKALSLAKAIINVSKGKTPLLTQRSLPFKLLAANYIAGVWVIVHYMLL